MIVDTQREVAEEFGCTVPNIQNWLKRGMPKTEDGKYDVDAIRVWKSSNILSNTGRGHKTCGDNKLEENIVALRTSTKMGIATIAKTLGIGERKVRGIVRVIDKHRPNLEMFKAQRADIFAAEQMEYLEHITDAKLKKATARDLSGMAKLAWEKERIERGESVDNVAVIVKHINAMKEKEEDADPGRS